MDTIDTTAIAVRDRSVDLVRAEDFMPVLTVDQAVEKKNMMNAFISKVLKETKDGGEGDYGQMPGGQKKKILFKPGAEKLCSIFGLAPQYSEDKIVEDWTGAAHGGEPLFYYSYRCGLTRGGRFMGEAIGSCNSWESKYRYRWVSEDVVKTRPDWESLPTRGGKKTLFEPDFALDKSETTGKYGKPAEYWARFKSAAEAGIAKRTKKKLGPREYTGYEMTVDETQYRIPNPDVADVINTCQKMAQKRALVAAVLVVTNCSDAFTQDLEDFSDQDTKPSGEPVPTEATSSGELPSGRPVPVELGGMFERIDKDIKSYAGAFGMLQDEACRIGGTVNGMAAVERVTKAFRAAVPKGTETKGQLKDCLVDLWLEIQKLETAVADPA